MSSPPTLPLSGVGRWGLSFPPLPLSVCDLGQVTSRLEALVTALEENFQDRCAMSYVLEVFGYPGADSDQALSTLVLSVLRVH